MTGNFGPGQRLLHVEGFPICRQLTRGKNLKTAVCRWEACSCGEATGLAWDSQSCFKVVGWMWLREVLPPVGGTGGLRFLT